MVLLSVAMQWTALPWDFVLIFLVLAIVVPWRGHGSRSDAAGRAAAELGASASHCTVRRSLSSGWLRRITIWRSVAHGFSPAALGLLPAEAGARGSCSARPWPWHWRRCRLSSLRQLARLPLEKRGHLYQIAARLMPQELTEGLVFAALVGTVSLCEELIYRGFVFAVFRELGGGSAALAIAGHRHCLRSGILYQGRRGVASTFVLGLLLAGARSWSDSLLPPILAHLAVDLMAGLAGRQRAQAGAGAPGPR